MRRRRPGTFQGAEDDVMRGVKDVSVLQRSNREVIKKRKYFTSFSSSTLKVAFTNFFFNKFDVVTMPLVLMNAL